MGSGRVVVPGEIWNSMLASGNERPGPPGRGWNARVR